MPAYEFRRGFCTLVLSYSDEEWDQPLITEEAFLHRTLPMEIDTRILQEPLVHYSVLSETSFHIMQGLRMQCRRKIRFPDQMDYLMYILGKRENGLQIVYYCLKETQHRFHRHRMIVQGLERKAQRIVGSTPSALSQGLTKELPFYQEPEHESIVQDLETEDRRDDEPQITEEVFFSETSPAVRVYVEVLVPVLKKHGILLDESIMSSLGTDMGRVDELHYVMYRLGKKENGLQIFYRCLRETQDECPQHMQVADKIESKASYIAFRRMSSELVTAHVTETGTTPSLPAPSSPVESRLPQLLQRSKSQEDFQQSQLPTASSWILSSPMTSSKHLRSFSFRRKSAKADPAKAGTAPSEIPLPAPSSPVESQQSSVSQGTQLPSPSSTTEPEETVVYTGEACSHVSQNGISFHFPASESKYRVELRFKVVNDDYVLPEGYEDMPLVSSMFKITASDELLVPVIVQMEHCAIIEEDDSLVHMIAHGPPPYYFQPLLSGTFPLGERYGEIQVKRFSVLTTLANKLGLRLSLSVQVFYHDHSSATFVATKNLQRLISAVKSKYAAANRVVEQSMSCGYETEAITLTVPDPPQEGGWCVLPEFEPAQIETKLIREYREGRTPPGVHLKMKWTGEGEPVEEDIRIAVGGTSVDSFLLSCKSAPTTDSMPTSTQSTPTSQSQPPSCPLQSNPAQPTSSLPRSSPVSQPTLDAPVPPRSPVQSGTKSVELIALQRCSDVFCGGVDPNTLATNLRAKGLLTRQEYKRATQTTAVDDQRNNEILTALERRVSADSRVFHTVVHLLQEEPALKAVGDRMQEIFEEERAGQ